MSTEILRHLVLALNLVVLERVDRGLFRIIGRAQDWFAPFRTETSADPALVRPAERSLFFESFLEDAEHFWETDRSGQLSSGPWSERLEGGRTGTIEAVAYCLGKDRVLTLHKLTSGAWEERQLLQRARQNNLLAERLERVKDALQKSDEQKRTLIAELEENRANLEVVLDQLRVGTQLLDRSGEIVFVNQVCRRILGLDDEQIVRRHWSQVWPFPSSTQLELHKMLSRPTQERRRIAAYLEGFDKRRFWMEIDVRDDPYDPERHILFFYDMTEVEDLRRLLDGREQSGGIIGESEPVLQLRHQIDQLSRVDTAVLIEGETGTGKELVARQIHARSERSAKPFVAVNCAGLTESVLASQLFGHKRGAFTGAVADQQGLFEAAQGGTLFLDEVGDMPPAVQASVLRVLQEKEIMRLGETKTRKIDVRILAATHKTLRDEVASGQFRSDLYYRIRVAPIRLPPLRERSGDLSLLARFFLREFREALRKPVQDFGTEAMYLLAAYDWPGNVRELRSAVEFAVIRCRGTRIQPEDLPAEVSVGEQANVELRRAPAAAPVASTADEKERLLSAIEAANGNRTKAARLAGMSRATFYRRLAEYGIERHPQRKAGIDRE